MLGEGLPWHFVITFFILGMFWGIRNYSNAIKMKYEDENINDL